MSGRLANGRSELMRKWDDQNKRDDLQRVSLSYRNGGTGMNHYNLLSRNDGGYRKEVDYSTVI